MAKSKVCFIVSQVHKSFAFEWIAAGLKEKYELSFILLNPSNSPLEYFLVNHKIDVKRITYRDKKDFITAFFKTLLFLISLKPKVVHAHLLDAQLIGLSSAKIAGVKSRIYTRHNSNFHHVYFKKGVLLDKISNWLATTIISISQATDTTLLQLERVPLTKVVKIPHGFDLRMFAEVPRERVQQVRSKWKIPLTKPVIGIVARHIEWKGIQYIIPAFENFIKSYPVATLILANSVGPYHEAILQLLKNIPTENVILIPFEEDIAALYRLFDIYIHTPVDSMCEAFGQTYVEALASGVPSIFSLSGIAKEFVEHKKNAWVVDFKDTLGIQQGMEELWVNNELRNQLMENGRQAITSRFEISSMITRLTQVYDK